MRPYALLAAGLALAACWPRSPGVVQRPGPDAGTDASAWVLAQPAACGELRGRVLDRVSGSPIAGAQLALETGAVGGLTDSTGAFSVRLQSAAALTVHVRRLGYGSAGFTVAEGGAMVGHVADVRLESAGSHTQGVSLLAVRSTVACTAGR